MNSEGIGLGLNIVKQIIDLSGGSISAHSDGLGHGSTFTFSMKMKENDLDSSFNSIEF